MIEAPKNEEWDMRFVKKHEIDETLQMIHLQLNDIRRLENPKFITEQNFCQLLRVNISRDVQKPFLLSYAGNFKRLRTCRRGPSRQLTTDFLTNSFCM
jgi:hypothetical protein